MIPTAPGSVTDPWLDSGRDEILAQRDEVAECQPHLEWDTSDPIIELSGLFVVRHPETGESLHGYDILVRFPRAFPEHLPRVWEIGGRLPRHDRERHIHRKTGCCLFVDEEFHLRNPDGYTVAEFLQGPVHDFFLGQYHYELHDEWPWPVREHVAEGIEDAYLELLNLDDRGQVLECVKLLRRGEFKGRKRCPCSSGQRIRNCHGERFRELIDKIPAKTFRDTLSRLHGRTVPVEASPGAR